VYDLVHLFSEAMASRGITGKSVWLVETNAPPIDDPYWRVADWTLSVSLPEQAAFMPQAMASALAAGAERIAVYKLQDTPSDKAANPEPFGLVKRDGSRRPAFDTYRVAIQQLQTATAVTRERWDEIGQFQVYQEAQTTTLLFARLPQPQVAKVDALVEQAKLVDMWGKRLDDVVAHNGVFTIELPGALCSQSIGDYCMIGGTTYYLIQETPSQPPPPTATATPTVTATALPTKPPSPTATATMTPLPTATATATVAPTETEVMSTKEVATAVTQTPEPQSANETTPSLYWGLVFVALLLVLLIGGWVWTRMVR
jgi:hypothetical protein